MARGEEIDEKPPSRRTSASSRSSTCCTAWRPTLASLDDVYEIAAAITEELHTILDYHNCRVYVMQEDGWTLLPIAFRGEIFYEYEHETLEELITQVGEGITGWVAEHRTSVLTPDARLVEFAVQIPDTEDILESMLAVPMTVGDAVQGVIVLSSLGYGAFDEEDQRLLEVLASHAAIAISNAKLLQAEREAAETSSALLGLSKRLTQLRSVGDILQGAIETVSSLIDAAAVAFHVRDEHTGDFRLARLLTLDPRAIRPRHEIGDVPESVASSVVFDDDEPLVLSRQLARSRRARITWSRTEPREVLVAPRARGSRTEPARSRSSAVRATGSSASANVRLHPRRRRPDVPRAGQRAADVRARTVPRARRRSGRRVLGGVDPGPGVHVRRGRDATTCSAATPGSWPDETRAWGSHIDERDREEAMAGLQRAIESGVGEGLEYRVPSDDGSPRWIRDLIHVIRGRGRRPDDPPRPDGRHHRAQAGGASAARERAEVLGRLQA